MKERKVSKFFMWTFFLPVGLWTFYGLITFILDNTVTLDEKIMFGQLGIIFSAMWIIPWFIICLIMSLLINYLKTIFYKKGVKNEK